MAIHSLGRKIMKPGQELDMLIATHVFNAETITEDPEQPGEVPYLQTDHWVHYPKLNGKPHNGTYIGGMPAYSLFIQSAWPVVEMMEGQCAFKCGRDLNKPGSKWANPEGSLCFANFISIEGGDHYVIAKTTPHAICLAALKAKGIEIDGH